jgi:peptidase M49-like protein
MNRTALFSILSASALVGAAGAVTTAEAPVPDLAALTKMAARFAPVDIGADVSKLPAEERQALVHLIEAARQVDAIFLRQVWGGNPALLMDLADDASPLGRARYNYFVINKGPWDRLEHNAAFIPGAPAKPEGANFYPAGATKADVEAWQKTLSESDRAAATGFFTAIRRGPSSGSGADGKFTSVPYSVEYQGELAIMADRLRAAANATRQPTLKKFLSARADALLSNDYYASDVAWMELDASLEPTIGPYEVYEDEWFNAKAAYEAFITIRDDAESKKLQLFDKELQGLENALPIDPKLRNPKLGALAPISVVNVVFTAGDANRGVQTAAYNLPNDERVIREKGSKRVMLKNMQEAKFSRVLLPIAKVALSTGDQANVAFDVFFTHILMHELMHGLGPHNITAGGRATTVRQELKDTYSAIEEAKADVSGLWALQQLVDKGTLPKDMERTMYTTFLASSFRSIRFGVNEAHGKGVAVQLNYFLDHKGVEVNADGTFVVRPEALKKAITALTGEIMTLQAEGSYAKAQDMLKRLGVIRPEVKKVLDRLTDVPVDIAPRFVTAEALAAGK